VKKWLIGFAAALGAVAGGVTTAELVRGPQTSVRHLDNISLWTEADGTIYYQEVGRPAVPLSVSDTAEAQTLRVLLANKGATRETPYQISDRLTLVGGGGDAFHWDAPKRPLENIIKKLRGTHKEQPKPQSPVEAGPVQGAPQP
jgi:hypothetical protein